MSAQGTPVRLHVAASRWLREGVLLAPQPYHRVTKVETPFASIETTIEDPCSSETTETSINEITLVMSGIFTHRLLWYFKRYLANSGPPRFDCHHFAWWLTTGVAYPETRTPNIAIYHQQPLTIEHASMAADGTLSVVNVYNPHRKDIDTLHSMVKFGDFYLQVMARGGFLGVLDHTESEIIADYYRRDDIFT